MKKLFKITAIAIIAFAIIGCASEIEEEKTIDEILKEKDYIVVDVRTKEEYDEGHVVNSINIPYDEIDENTDLDKDKPILVYCKSGVRSEKAYNTLKELGYDVYDLGAYDSVTLKKTK